MSILTIRDTPSVGDIGYRPVDLVPVPLRVGEIFQHYAGFKCVDATPSGGAQFHAVLTFRHHHAHADLVRARLLLDKVVRDLGIVPKFNDAVNWPHWAHGELPRAYAWVGFDSAPEGSVIKINNKLRADFKWIDQMGAVLPVPDMALTANG